MRKMFPNNPIQRKHTISLPCTSSFPIITESERQSVNQGENE